MMISISETTIHVSAPEVTADRRKALEQVVREHVEEAKKSIRSIREKVLGDIRSKKAEGVLSEDEEFLAKKQLQEKVDQANEEVKGMCSTKIDALQE